MKKTRTETDPFGPIEVDTSRNWGAQAQRSLGNFKIGWEKQPAPIVRALGIVKRAATKMTAEDGSWTPEEAEIFFDKIDPHVTQQVYGTVVYGGEAFRAGRQEFARMQPPTLFLYGDADVAIKPATIRGMEDHSDDYRLEILPGLGHFCIEQAPEVIAAYREWIAGVPVELTSTIKLLRFQAGSTPPDIVFDESYLSNTPDFAGVGSAIGGLWMQAVPIDDPDNHMRKFRFGSTTYAALPRYRVRIEAGEESIELDYRLKRLILANGPAQLMGARVALAEGTAEVRDYWRLVYAADWHLSLIHISEPTRPY